MPTEKVALDIIKAAKGVDPRRDKNPEALKALMATIEKEGVLHPPILRRVASGFEVVAGNRRVAAIRALIKQGRQIPGPLRMNRSSETKARADG